MIEGYSLFLVEEDVTPPKHANFSTVRYLRDENDVSKAGTHKNASPGGVVDILEACGAFDPGSSPGRGVSSFSTIAYMF